MFGLDLKIHGIHVFTRLLCICEEIFVNTFFYIGAKFTLTPKNGTIIPASEMLEPNMCVSNCQQPCKAKISEMGGADL